MDLWVSEEKCLLPRWETNHTSPTCWVGALTTRLQSYPVITMAPQYYSPPHPRDTARSFWCAKEIDPGVAPGTLTFIVRTLAVLRTPNTTSTGR
ncbi:hypothetical protein Zmor_017976 [Zophobas morio]|uniref:Uncharacterized protein n=1 Tax=Zophobas morio TaxID=2755281 RepID=A0AA38IDH9_9CUCU|nr:hypothetical protein Zmor_017976 [Zophobas morio]